MCSEEGGDYLDMRRLTYATNDAQYFEFVLSRESITAFDFDTTSSLCLNLFHSVHSLLVELLFGEPMQEIDRIEDASTASRYFGITQPLYLIDKFLFTTACIDQMGVRVAEAWHH